MKTRDTIYSEIVERIEAATKKKLRKGSMDDFEILGISSAMEAMYQSIEDMRNPHVYSRLTGEELDDLGFFFSCPRLTNETDTDYFSRMINWKKRIQAGNRTAIDDSVTQLTYASIAKHFPLTHGCNTGTIYIVPKTFDDETIAKAKAEVQERVEKILSPGHVMFYIVPEIRYVSLLINIKTTGDLALAKNNITKRMKEYINSIAPGQYLEAGTINAIGQDETGVSFFQLLSFEIYGAENLSTQIMQEMQKKFLYNTTTWIEVE